MRKLNLKKDKRGIYPIILFFIIIFSILIIGFVLIIGVSILGHASDEITPIVEGLGVVGDTNLTQPAEDTFGIGNNLIQSLPLMVAFVYILALIFSIVMVAGYNYNSHPMFIGVYFAFILLLIVFSIIMSNMYEDIYNGHDVIAQRLQDSSTMSYMILYSPIILTIIAFIAGIFFFGVNKEGGTTV